ncbi:MAG: hypothetical protein LBG52_05920 [Candidatus Peribacteria bacterium]|nr:hypothetical protein [Candidatus Peribacteria bacterium]
MQKRFTLFNLKHRKQMVMRFPLPVVIVGLLTLLFFWLNNGNVSYESTTMEFLEKSIVSLMLVFFFSIGMSFVGETIKCSQWKQALFQLIPLVF